MGCKTLINQSIVIQCSHIHCCPQSVTVTELFVLCPLMGDRGRISKQSSVFPVSVGRLEQKCFQLATKSSGRPQQLQLCRQPVPCLRCANRESPVASLSTRSPGDEACSADRVGTSATDVSKSEMYTGVCPRSDLWTIRHSLYWILSSWQILMHFTQDRAVP